jgi:DNA-binding MarR family transcriptional regulator
MRAFSSTPGQQELDSSHLAEELDVLQMATRVLTGVALRSLEVLDGAVTLPQFRVLSVLAGLGEVRSARVARALGIEASTVTRLADRLVAAGHVTRGSDPGHRGVVTLDLTPSGRQLVEVVEDWRRRELTRILLQLPADEQGQVTTALRSLIAAAGAGYGATAHTVVRV